MNRTEDDMSVIHEFPDPEDTPDMWIGGPIDDDVVLSHGESVLNPTEWRREHSPSLINEGNMGLWIAAFVVPLVAFAVVLYRRRSRGLKSGYTSLPQSAA